MQNHYNICHFREICISHDYFSFTADLQVLNAELVSIHIDGREEDGLHLVVPKLIRGEVGGDQHLSKQDEY